MQNATLIIKCLSYGKLDNITVDYEIVFEDGSYIESVYESKCSFKNRVELTNAIMKIYNINFKSIN